MRVVLSRRWRLVLPILAAVFVGALSGQSSGVERLETPLEDLNRVAVRHTGYPVQWGGFGVEFTATQVAFSRLKQDLIVTAFGRFSDQRASETTGTNSEGEDRIELDLRLRYVIDTSRLDPKLGITTADESQIIEVYCLVADSCVVFEAWQDGRQIEPLKGMEPGLLAGFGRPSAELDPGVGEPTLIGSIVETVNAMRVEAGLDAIVD